MTVGVREIPAAVTLPRDVADAVAERVALANLKESTDLFVGEDIDWCLTEFRWAHPGHGARIEPALDEPTEQLLQGSVSIGCGGRGVPCQDAFDERVDMVATGARSPRWDPVGVEKGLEPLAGLETRLHRARPLPLSAERASPGRRRPAGSPTLRVVAAVDTARPLAGAVAWEGDQERFTWSEH